MKEGNIILDKSKAFALRVIRLYKYLCQEKKEFILSKQIVRSGTSIGANAKEAHAAQSKADFYAKLSISLSKRQPKQNIGWKYFMKVTTLTTIHSIV